MAVKKEQEDLHTIEDLKTVYDTTDVIFAGVCTKKGWNAGKQITDSDYIKSVADFLRAPLGRR